MFDTVVVNINGCCARPDRRRGRAWLTFGRFREQSRPFVYTGIRSSRLKALEVSVALQMSSSQQTEGSFQLQDNRGNPTEPDGVPVWSTDNSDILDVVPAADGRSAVIKAKGPLGTANVQVECDADLGTGVAPLILLGEITVTAGQAVTGTLTFAPPTEQPA